MVLSIFKVSRVVCVMSVMCMISAKMHNEVGNTRPSSRRNLGSGQFLATGEHKAVVSSDPTKSVMRSRHHKPSFNSSASRKLQHATGSKLRHLRQRTSQETAFLPSHTSKHHMFRKTSENPLLAKIKRSGKRDINAYEVVRLPNVRPRITFGGVKKVRRLNTSPRNHHRLRNGHIPGRSGIKSIIDTSRNVPFRRRPRYHNLRTAEYVKSSGTYKRHRAISSPLNINSHLYLKPTSGVVGLRSKKVGVGAPRHRFRLRPHHASTISNFNQYSKLKLPYSTSQLPLNIKNQQGSLGTVKQSLHGGAGSSDLSLSASIRHIQPKPPLSTVLHIKQIPFSEGLNYIAPHNIILPGTIKEPSIGENTFEDIEGTISSSHSLINPDSIADIHENEHSISLGSVNHGEHASISEHFGSQQNRAVNSKSTLFYSSTDSLHGKDHEKPLATGEDERSYDNIDLKGLLRRYIAKQQQLLSLTDEPDKNTAIHSAKQFNEDFHKTNLELEQKEKTHKSGELFPEKSIVWESLKQHLNEKHQPKLDNVSGGLRKFEFAGAIHDEKTTPTYVYEDDDSNQLVLSCLHCSHGQTNSDNFKHPPGLIQDDIIVKDMPLSIDDVKIDGGISSLPRSVNILDSYHNYGSPKPLGSTKPKRLSFLENDALSSSSNVMSIQAGHSSFKPSSSGFFTEIYDPGYVYSKGHMIFPYGTSKIHPAQSLSSHETRLFRPSDVLLSRTKTGKAYKMSEMRTGFSPPPIMYGGFKPITREYPLNQLSLYSRKKRKILWPMNSHPSKSSFRQSWRRQKRSAMVTGSVSDVMMNNKQQPHKTPPVITSDDEQYRILADVHKTMRQTIDMVDVPSFNETTDSLTNIESKTNKHSEQMLNSSYLSSAANDVPESATQNDEEIHTDSKLTNKNVSNDSSYESDEQRALRQHTMELIKQLKASGTIPKNTEFKPKSNIASLSGYLIPKNGGHVEPLNGESRIIIRNVARSAQALTQYGTKKQTAQNQHQQPHARQIFNKKKGSTSENQSRANRKISEHNERKEENTTVIPGKNAAIERMKIEKEENISEKNKNLESDNESDIKEAESNSEMNNESNEDREAAEESSDEEQDLLNADGHKNILFPLDPHGPHAYRPEHYYRPYRDSVILQVLRRVMRGFNRLFFGPHYANHIEYEGLYGVHRRKRRVMIGR